MAKEKVKQWGLVMVVATWLLTTLSACAVLSKAESLRLDLQLGYVSVPTYMRGSHEVIYVDGQSCPAELFGGRWEPAHAPLIDWTYSQTIDKSGVQVITAKESWGFPTNYTKEHTYIVDGKIHDGKVHMNFVDNNEPKYTYAASCNFKLKDFNYKVFRVVKNYARGATVEDYIVGGKLEGSAILGSRNAFLRDARHLDLKNSLSVTTRYDQIFVKFSQ